MRMKATVTVELYPINWDNLSIEERNSESLRKIYLDRLDRAMNGPGLPVVLINTWRDLQIEIIEI